MNYLKIVATIFALSFLSGCGVISDLMVDDICYIHPNNFERLTPVEQQKIIDKCGGLPKMVKVSPTRKP